MDEINFPMVGKDWPFPCEMPPVRIGMIDGWEKHANKELAK